MTTVTTALREVQEVRLASGLTLTLIPDNAEAQQAAARTSQVAVESFADRSQNSLTSGTATPSSEGSDIDEPSSENSPSATPQQVVTLDEIADLFGAQSLIGHALRNGETSHLLVHIRNALKRARSEATVDPTELQSFEDFRKTLDNSPNSVANNALKSCAERMLELGFLSKDDGTYIPSLKRSRSASAPFTSFQEIGAPPSPSNSGSSSSANSSGSSTPTVQPPLSRRISPEPLDLRTEKKQIVDSAISAEETEFDNKLWYRQVAAVVMVVAAAILGFVVHPAFFALAYAAFECYRIAHNARRNLENRGHEPTFSPEELSKLRGGVPLYATFEWIRSKIGFEGNSWLTECFNFKAPKSAVIQATEDAQKLDDQRPSETPSSNDEPVIVKFPPENEDARIPLPPTTPAQNPGAQSQSLSLQSTPPDSPI